MGLKFLSLASGSSGNCYYLGDESEGVLIDAGISSRKIKKILRENAIDISTIKALCITHDHSDHILSAGYLGEREGLPVYATREIIQGMNRNFRMVEKLYTAQRFIQKGQTFNIGKFEITTFGVPHDGTDNVGYHIKYDDITIMFATDLGHITPTIKRYMQQVNYMVIESNYDVDMLQNGRYHPNLKRRVSGENGHLSNIETALTLCDIYKPHLKKVFLCHISAENNTPELAYNTVSKAMIDRGIDVGGEVEVIPLVRTKPTEIVELN